MRNLCLTIAYDGSAYKGWQFQPDAPTVQGTIEAVLRKMTGTTSRLRGAARTDAGVHAESQLANVRLNSDLSCAKLIHGLNALLPADILVRSLIEVHDGFEARRDNFGKHYAYRLWNSGQRSLPWQGRAYQLHRQLDLLRMAEAAAKLVGKHDFVAFRAADCDRETTVRTLYRCSIARDGPLITVDVEGTAFLKNMVRILVGTLIDVATGKLSPRQTEGLLQGGVRADAGMTLPAHGLTLARVFANFDA